MPGYVPLDEITSEEQIRALIPGQFGSQTGKIIDWIETEVGPVSRGPDSLFQQLRDRLSGSGEFARGN